MHRHTDYLEDFSSALQPGKAHVEEHESILGILPEGVDPKIFQTALSADKELELSPMGHLKMQAAFQRIRSPSSKRKDSSPTKSRAQ